MSTPGDSGSDPRSDHNADAERDAWLRQALRHAPDANAGAPQAVSDAILRKARQATANATTAAVPSAHRPTRVQPARSRLRTSSKRGTTPWATLWSWLVQPRVAAGFASLMVATLVGVMWWGRPMDDVLTEARAPLDAPLAARVEAPAPRAAVAAPAAPMPRDPEAANAAATPAPKGANEDRLAMKRNAATPTATATATATAAPAPAQPPTPMQAKINPVTAAKPVGAPEASSTLIDSKRSERDRLLAAAVPTAPAAQGTARAVAEAKLEAKREAEVPAENPGPGGRADAGRDAASPSSANLPEQADAPAAPTAREQTEGGPRAQYRS